MNYRIIGTDGAEIDRRSWPGHRWLQAALLEDYCEDHDYEIVKTRPNSTFTEITVTMTGVCPLMMNNPQTVNPMNEYAKALKELTSKRSKTDDDQNEIFHLKFLASCYVNNKGQYIIPANMISKSFEAGAKENRLGTKFQRSVFVFSDCVLKFPENGCTPEELWKNHSEKYVDIRPVGIQKSKIVTARMIIPEWSTEGELFFDETQLNKSEVWLAMTNAGLRYGIGTYRQCYGRYSIEEIKDDKKKKK